MALPSTANAIDFKITTQPTKTYAIDFENKRIVGKTDGLEAMVQDVRKLLTTSRYAERIYSGDYGSELETLIGNSFGYIKAKVRQLLEDAFSADSRIRGIRRLEVVQTETDAARIQAYILTEYGEIYVEHTIRG
jgi:phage baseplate assembly protein W